MKNPSHIGPKLQRQRGFALMELTFAILIAGALAIWAAAKLQNDADDLVAASTAIHLENLATAGQKYILTNYEKLAASQDVAGVANDLKPTRDELIALGRLASGSPQYTAGQMTSALTITKSGCPGTTCSIIANACLTTPYTLRGKYRDDGATQTMMALAGKGGRSQPDAPSVIRGANMNFPNPYGSAVGIVCSQSVVDAGFYESFVKMNDSRDPNFQGGMTISGTNSTGEALRINGDMAVVDPATGNVCVQILKAGVININCQGKLNATTGTFTGPLGTVKVGDTSTAYTVDSSGKIRGTGGFWSATGSIFGDNTLGARASGTVFTIQTASGQDALAVHDSGRTGSRVSIATPILGLTDPVTPGQSCGTPTGQVGATQVTSSASAVVRAITGGGLAICDSASGTWVALGRTGSLGSTCNLNGTTALSSTGVMLICTNGQWTSLQDRMGYMVAAESWRAVDGSVIPKPSCSPGSTGSRLFVAPGNEQQNIQYVNRFAYDNGGSWTIKMTNGSNASIAGDMLVMSYCTY